MITGRWKQAYPWPLAFFRQTLTGTTNSQYQVPWTGIPVGIPSPSSSFSSDSTSSRNDSDLLYLSQKRFARTFRFRVSRPFLHGVERASTWVQKHSWRGEETPTAAFRNVLEEEEMDKALEWCRQCALQNVYTRYKFEAIRSEDALSSFVVAPSFKGRFRDKGYEGVRWRQGLSMIQ